MSNTAELQPRKTPRLIVGFDYTESALCALDQAARFCSTWPGTEVIVVHCTDGHAQALPDETEEAAETRLLQQLMATVQEHFELLESNGSAVRSAVATAHVSKADPVTAITGLAYLEGADLILVGKTNKGGLERLVLGSVATEVIKKAPCSVLVCRDPLEETIPRIEPPLAAGAYASHLGRRHTYHHQSRNSEAKETMPLVFPMH